MISVLLVIVLESVTSYLIVLSDGDDFSVNDVAIVLAISVLLVIVLESVTSYLIVLSDCYLI